MVDCKPISTPMLSRVKLTKDMSPSSSIYQNVIKEVPYVNDIGHLIYLTTI
jgi:hypothetical protein